MSYLALARKYRPARFADLVGQEHVARTLSNAIALGRIPHALVFTGVRGVGKTSAARIFARSVNCERGPTAEPCAAASGEAAICAVCNEVLAGSAVDVVEIDGASNNGVDQVRDLRESVKYLPQHGRFKVVIIDEVHMLSQAAFNALLKTLEEPPPHVIFVFATTEVHRIPATIMSRCQRFDFRKIPTAAIAAQLRVICDAERVDADGDALLLVARAGAGSLRDAISNLDQVIAYGSGQLAAGSVSELLGLLDRRALLAFARALAARDVDGALGVIHRLLDRGAEVRPIIDDWLQVARDLAVAKWSSSRELFPDVADSEAAEIAEIAKALQAGLAERWFSMTERAAGDILRASDPVLSLEVLVLRLLRAGPARSIDELLGEVRAIEARLSGATASPRVLSASASATAPVPASARAPASFPSNPRLNASVPTPGPTPGPTPDFDSWARIVEQVRESRAPIAGILEQGRLVRCDAEGVVLRFAKGAFLADKLGETSAGALVATAIRATLGDRATFNIERGERDAASETLAERRAREEARSSAATRKELLANPVVSAVQSLFEAEVREVRLPGKQGPKEEG